MAHTASYDDNCKETHGRCYIINMMPQTMYYIIYGYAL